MLEGRIRGQRPIADDIKQRCALLEKAYAEHKRRLVTISAVIVGEKHQAEDIVHDVFTHLAVDGGVPRDVRKWGAYLAVCVRNRALVFLRKRQAEEGRAARMAQTADSLRAEDPADLASRAEEDSNLLKLVDQLPGEERDALALKVWGGLGFRDIAKLQKVTKSTAHARYCRALERLNRRLTGGMGDEAL